MSVAQLIATHMNVPYGGVVSAADVVASLRAGRLSAATKAANDILSGVFVKLEPRVIMRCAQQEQIDLASVHQLYLDTLRAGVMVVPKWETAFQALTSP